MMKKYKLLPYNKWAEEDEENTIVGYLELRYLHHHHKIKGEKLWLLQQMQFVILLKKNYYKESMTLIHLLTHTS
ncbi:MAG: hypothetical protein CMF74_15960 [Maricaulis sp.]|nr:hypothetical protein [Maricaulis sp.]